MDPTIELALETIQMNKQAIVFCSSRASAEKTALDIAKCTNMRLPIHKDKVLSVLPHPTSQCEKLGRVINRGVAFHHSGLINKQKDIIEEGFKNKEIKIVCATPTLAAGLSLPAYRVILKSLKRYSGKWGMDWIPVLEYKQMAGRAGRPEYENIGEAISIAKTEPEKDEIHERFVLGKPEEIYSKLAVEPVLRTYLLSLIASGIIRDEQSMKDFFSKTFWAHQFQDMPKLLMIMDKMLGLLSSWNFITLEGGSKGDFVRAADLQKDTNRQMRPTPIGKRISELYLDPLTAKHLLDGITKSKEKEITVFSWLQMISHTLEMRPLLRIRKSEEQKVQDAFMKRYEFLLEDEPSAFDQEYVDFINSVKTALYFENWIDEKDEKFLLETFGIRPGEIRAKNDSADWLLYSCVELAKCIEDKNAVRDLTKLRTRIKYGVKEEIMNLLQIKGIGRVRARKLFSNGVKGIGDLKKADIATLTQLLGTKNAQNVKKQMGQEIEIVPERKRKGQMSLGKW